MPAQPIASRASAALVHLYTAAGAVLAFVGIRAVFAGDYRFAFATMFAATMVDATDGLLARRARVKEVLPHLDGAHLDDIVDYVTFVFLPIVLLDRAGDLPAEASLGVAAIVLLSSAFGFSFTDAKTSDHFFTGFPSYWNIVALYLHLLAPGPWINAAVLILLSGLIFVRVGYVYPSRTPVLRGVTVTAGVIWGAAIAVMIWLMPSPPRTLVWWSLLFPAYYTALSLVLHARRRRSAGA